MKCSFILLFGQFGPVDIVSVCFINRNGVCNLQDAFFYTLKFVASTGNLQNKKKIDHGGNSRFRLANSNCFNDNNIEASSFTDKHGFPRFTCNTTKASTGWGRANKGIMIDR